MYIIHVCSPRILSVDFVLSIPFSLPDKIQAIDKDGGENGDICYKLLRDRGDLFQVDRRNGAIFLRRVLDCQHHSKYELMVVAYGGGTPRLLSSEALIRLKVVVRPRQ